MKSDSIKSVVEGILIDTVKNVFNDKSNDTLEKKILNGAIDAIPDNLGMKTTEIKNLARNRLNNKIVIAEYTRPGDEHKNRFR
jgi:hypothetical protein